MEQKQKKQEVKPKAGHGVVGSSLVLWKVCDGGRVYKAYPKEMSLCAAMKDFLDD